MANLIIKSSANDLVIQGSDESPAITVGTDGTTTFAENATLSGTANNLGTVTAGTLNSTVTFPAGMVLQVIQGTPSTTGYNSTSMTDVTCTNWTATINKSISGSSIFASWHCSYSTYQGNNGNAAQLKIFFNRTAPSSVTDIDEQFAYVADEGGDTYHNVYSGHSGSFEDTSSATGNHTYVAHIEGGSPSSSVPSGVITNSGEATLVLMEVIT